MDKMDKMEQACSEYGPRDTRSLIAMICTALVAAVIVLGLFQAPAMGR
jgi:hypothetical protein